MVENELLYENDVSNSGLDGKPRLHSFFNKDGLLLRTYSWTVKKAIGIFLLIHGLNGHVRLQYLRQNVEVISNDKAILKDQDNYYVYKDSWIEKLNDKGYSVYGIDLQGHGLSEGWENLKANINNFDDLVYDVIQYLEEINRTVCLDYERNKYLRAIREKNTDMKALKKDKIPIYIMGLSMGGNVVLRTLELLGKSGDYKNLNIKGCISLSGMICLEELSSKASMKYKYFLVPFSKFISYIFPKCRINQNFNFEMFPFVNDIINFDKHRSKKWITFKFGHQILRSITNLRKDIQYIPKDIPILFVHSIHDCACYYGGVVTFYDQLDNDKKELYTIYDMDHLLTMEPGNEKVLEKVLDWISGSFNNKRRRRKTSS